MNVLVVSPHPDDETLGAAGTIFRLKDQGNKVSWLNITNMSSDMFTERQIQIRRQQIKKIVEFYGFADVRHLNLSTAKLDQYVSSDIISQISDYIKKVKPEMLILPDYNDAHSDHRCVFEWSYACTKIFRYPYITKVLTMEIISETDFGNPIAPFVPNYYVDITNYIEKKINAMKIYQTEMGMHPFPRSEEHIRALALIRGVSAGCKYAEAFRLVKCIVS